MAAATSRSGPHPAPSGRHAYSHSRTARARGPLRSLEAMARAVARSLFRVTSGALAEVWCRRSATRHASSSSDGGGVVPAQELARQRRSGAAASITVAIPASPAASMIIIVKAAEENARQHGQQRCTPRRSPSSSLHAPPHGRCRARRPGGSVAEPSECLPPPGPQVHRSMVTWRLGGSRRAAPRALVLGLVEIVRLGTRDCRLEDDLLLELVKARCSPQHEHQ